jgi:hypothetical protein
MTLPSQLKANQVFNIASLIPAIVGVFCAVFLGYVFWWPPKPAYEVIHPETHSVTYTAEGKFIQIHRAYCINARTPVTISRDLILMGTAEDVEFRVNLPVTTQIYAMGCHKLDRAIEIPALTPPGVYRLKSVAVWQANAFRNDAVDLPDLKVVVRKP